MPLFRMMMVCFLLLWSVSAALAEGIAWVPQDKAVERAVEEGKHVYYYFYTPSCPSCQIMGNHTLEDPGVVSLLNGYFVSTKMHASFNRELAGSLGVMVVPTHIFFSADGDELFRQSGYLPPDEFMQVLKNLNSEK
ncbi:thioredoxin family protein [Desulfobotulus sp. H1]|uniref:Thioredoxin family protein n=1 Tax=Desulfobotulus pelophilus TaxID=2823377 RepID=A0ABT3NDM8_9BACT|nr:thioredoxin family protein [Desulfobotulus pelophilus]MCW7755042.1 thioredoxin family protein [Desulfobotulus pelophilus]